MRWPWTWLVRLAYEFFTATHDSHAASKKPDAFQDYAKSLIVPHHMPTIIGRE